ncbi:hypothetical protein [Amycolatopsis alkalitolerans]|uniref:hypothetical protein n=1 Tax=Amycolatopsis alkalitolerans TaxID=2547244 RepID=UPI0038993AFA
MRTAAAHPGQVAAVAGFHPGFLVTAPPARRSFAEATTASCRSQIPLHRPLAACPGRGSDGRKLPSGRIRRVRSDR